MINNTVFSKSVNKTLRIKIFIPLSKTKLVFKATFLPLFHLNFACIIMYIKYQYCKIHAEFLNKHIYWEYMLKLFSQVRYEITKLLI